MGTIKDEAVKLLCYIDYYENRDGGLDPRSVGLSYADILKIIQYKFPNCKTNLRCLRWYAVRIRAGEAGYEGHTLPQRRPRSSSG